jgi:hypothetical protein
LLKTRWFTDFVAKTREELVARIDQALKWPTGREKGNATT